MTARRGQRKKFLSTEMREAVRRLALAERIRETHRREEVYQLLMTLIRDSEDDSTEGIDLNEEE